MISDSDRDRLLHELIDTENVVGVCKESTKGRPCALVTEKKPEADLDDDQIVANRVPDDDVGVLEIGDVQSHSGAELDVMPDAQGDRHDRHRPTQSGLSATNIDSTACTLTGVAEVTNVDASTIRRSSDVDNGDYVYGFNCHCAAREGDAEFGSLVVQPSPYDGGSASDRIGTFCGYVPLEDGVRTDYSEALIDDLEQASTNVHDLDDSYGTDFVRDNYRQLIGTEVVNSGRTVGVKRSIVRAVGAKVPVKYGSGRTIETDNAIITKPPDGEPTMSEGGQSGAPVFSEAYGGDMFGVLYAGSDRATIMSTVAATEELAGVSFVGSDESLTDDGGDGGDGGDDGPDSPPDRNWIEWIFDLLRRYQDTSSNAGGQPYER